MMNQHTLTPEGMKTIVEQALDLVRFENFGIKPGFLKLRHDPMPTGQRSGEWQIPLWLRDEISRDIRIQVTVDSTPETIKQHIVQEIERQLPEWRQFLSAS